MGKLQLVFALCGWMCFLGCEDSAEPPAEPVSEDPGPVGTGDHWVEVTIGETHHRIVGDAYSYCSRTRFGEGEPFGLDLQISDQDDHGLWVSFDKFIGVYDMRSYPLRAKTYTKDTSGTGQDDLILKEVELPGESYETSQVEIGIRDQASSCHDEFVKHEDGRLTGTLVCARVYDSADVPTDMIVSFGCPLAESE